MRRGHTQEFGQSLLGLITKPSMTATVSGTQSIVFPAVPMVRRITTSTVDNVTIDVLAADLAMRFFGPGHCPRLVSRPIDELNLIGGRCKRRVDQGTAKLEKTTDIVRPSRDASLLNYQRPT